MLKLTKFGFKLLIRIYKKERIDPLCLLKLKKYGLIEKEIIKEDGIEYYKIKVTEKGKRLMKEYIERVKKS